MSSGKNISTASITQHGFKLIRSRRRTLSLAITPDAKIVIRAPHRLSMRYIHDFIRKKQLWITCKIAEMRLRPRPSKKRFAHGEQFLFLGEPHELQIPPQLSTDLRLAVTRWYREQAAMILVERCRLLSSQTGLYPKKIRISNASKRWGSCTSRGTVSFSWRLIMAPVEVIDYVIIHELAHLREMNHSSRFWLLVATWMPDYKRREEWLKRHGAQLVL